MVPDGSSLTAQGLAVEAYITKELTFKFRGRDFFFALSQGLFSAADIDTGTRLLLKVLSKTWDEDARKGLPLPKTLLDAGCGIGVIGICAAAALAGDASSSVRCQDRDELARLFTEYNALKNGIPSSLLSAHTEPLLGGPASARWDLILSNIPAKAGKPVLEDFVSRSAGLLNPSGRVLIVVVNPLANWFRSWIAKAGAPLLYEELGKEHSVFMYGSLNTQASPIQTGFFRGDAPYHRCSGPFEMEGIAYSLDAIQGLGDFDRPGGTAQAAAKLMIRLHRFPPDLSVLIHEPSQGHFPLWLLNYLEQEHPECLPHPLVLSGRNILALEASRYNISKSKARAVEILPLVDLNINREGLWLCTLLGTRKGWDLIVAFPEYIPQTNMIVTLWEEIGKLLVPEGILVIAFSSVEAERFDRKKPRDFTRLLDIKRKGFRALAYQLLLH